MKTYLKQILQMVMAGCFVIICCFLFQLKKEMDLEHEMFNGDEYYTYRESTLFAYEWQHYQKHFLDDVRHKRIVLDLVLSIMESEDVSIEKMDSIMGDSLWRVQENKCDTNHF